MASSLACLPRQGETQKPGSAFEIMLASSAEGDYIPARIFMNVATIENEVLRLPAAERARLNLRKGPAYETGSFRDRRLRYAFTTVSMCCMTYSSKDS